MGVAILQRVGGAEMISPEDKIVAAIERNTKAIDKFRSEVGSVGMWLFFILISGVGCPHAKASVLLPPLEQPAFTDIGTPPAPPPNPNMQYWYTMDVPTGYGVFPVEVFAPRLVANMASDPEPPLPPTHIPEPSTGLLMMAALLVVVAMQRRRV